MIKLDFKPEYENKMCNYCNMSDFKILSKKDRYGLPVMTVICKTCGLVFINPRMDKNSYEKFYQGYYRRFIQNYKNKSREKMEFRENFLASEKLGIKLALIFANYVNKGSLIEVGSSVGGILSGFLKTIEGLDVFGIDPSNEEASFANKMGIDTKVGIIEDLNIKIKAVDNIIIVRSLNHILDPKMFFDWGYAQLKIGGRLIVVVVNFLNFCQRKNRIITQIDHPFMFSEYTLKNFIELAGFTIVFEDYITRPDYLMVVAEKVDRTTFVDTKVKNLAYVNSLKRLNWKNLVLSKIKNKLNL